MMKTPFNSPFKKGEKSKNPRRKGFTLVELLVSISIIATLTAILLPNFIGARERAKDSQKIEDMTAIKNALRMYYNDHQSYPPGTAITNVESAYLSPYMAPSGVGYTYSQTNTGDGFRIWAYLDSGQGDDDIKSQTRCGIASPVDKVYYVCAN